MNLPLIERHRKSYHKSAINEGAEQLNKDIEALQNEFEVTSRHAPIRVSPKTYLHVSKGHDGIKKVPKNGDYRRVEEYLAYALFNLKDIRLSNGELVNLIDYQVPLKNEQLDKEVGKIDLLGIMKSALTLIELKTFANDKKTPDTPVKALVEAIAYSAIAKNNVNFRKLREEVSEHGIDPNDKLNVIIMAPSSYWRKFKECGDGKWINEITMFSKKFRPDISINFVEIEIEKDDLCASNPAPQKEGYIKPILKKIPVFKILFGT